MLHQAFSQPLLGSQIAPFGVASVLTDIARHDAITADLLRGWTSRSATYLIADEDGAAS
jgi:hypothetical protein